jgi:hypothetical protein
MNERTVFVHHLFSCRQSREQFGVMRLDFKPIVVRSSHELYTLMAE